MRGKRPPALSRRRPADPLRLLVFGDVVGKIGRRALAGILPSLKRRYRPHLTIANAENLAHGLGVTQGSLDELKAAGIDVFTSGNNVWSKDGVKLVASEDRLVRPANYPPGTPGRGFLTIEVAGAHVLIVNLQGRVFMDQQIDDPLRTLDAILVKHRRQSLQAIIVDMHAEASSEKGALAWYADGRVSAVLGTHTHVPTADARFLLKGTAFQTDLGMCGGQDTIIGTDRQAVIDHQLTQLHLKHELPERGPAIVAGAYLEVNPRTRRAVRIVPLQEFVTVRAGGKIRRRKGVGG